jgi:hypothetical protein
MIVAALYIFALLELIVGAVSVAVPQSAIQPMIGAVAIGFGIMTVGLAAILTQVTRSRQLFEGLAKRAGAG